MSIIQAVIASEAGAAPSPPPPQNIDAQFYSDTNYWYALGGNQGSGDQYNINLAAYTYPESTSGQVVEFNGTNSYIVSPNLKIGNGTWATNSITIDFWFYPTAGGVQLLGEYAQSNVGIGYRYTMLEINQNLTIKAMFWDGAATTSTNSVVLNQWNHVYWTEDSQGGHTLIVNGINTNGNPVYTRTAPSFGEYFAIGDSCVTNMGNTGRFQGKVGVLNIHDYVVPSTYETTKIRYVTPPLLLNVDASNTSSYSGTGTTWTNLAGGHDVTLVNTPTFNNGPAKSFTFGVNGSYAQTVGDIWFDQDFTIAAWVKLHSYAGWERIIDFGNGPDAHNIILAASSGTLGFPVLRSESTQFQTGITIPLNTWTHVVGRLKAEGTGAIFINGTAVAINQGMQMPVAISRSSCYIAKSNWSNDALLDGEIGELQIYHGAVSDQNITAIYTNTRTKYPNAYVYTTTHGQDSSKDNNWPYGFNTVSVMTNNLFPTPQVGWVVTDGTNTRTIISGGTVPNSVYTQNTAIGFITSLQLDGAIDPAATSVTIYGVV